MEPLVNDRWRGVLTVGPGPWEMTIEAWGDTFKSWQEEIHKKFDGHPRPSERVARGRGVYQEAATRAAGHPMPTCSRVRDASKNCRSRGNEPDRFFRRALRLDDSVVGPLALRPITSRCCPFGWTGRCLRRGMSSSRVRLRGSRTADRRFAIAFHGSTTPKQWASTSSISRRSIRSESPTEKVATIQ